MSRPREQLIDYAYGTLPESEAVRLEEHLRSCTACRSEVREVRQGLVELVEGLPRARVPKESWQGILARVRRQRVKRFRWVASGLAASLLLLAAAGTWGLQALDRSAQTRAESQTVARWLSREDTTRLSLGIYPSGGYGSILLLPDDRSLFVLSDPPPRGETYQVWGESDGGAASLGTFDRPVFEVDATGYTSLAVSLEPDGGSPEPTHVLGQTELPD